MGFFIIILLTFWLLDIDLSTALLVLLILWLFGFF